MADEKLVEQVSALVDGELERGEQPLLLRRLADQPGLRERWARYFLIGASLRDGLPPAMRKDFADAVAARIAREPAFAGQPSRRMAPLLRRAAGLAVAASVAAIALTSLRVDDPVGSGPEPVTVVPVPARQSQAPAPRFAASPGMSWEQARPEVQAQLNQYLLTHSDAAAVEPVPVEEPETAEVAR